MQAYGLGFSEGRVFGQGKGLSYEKEKLKRNGRWGSISTSKIHWEVV